MQGQKKLLRDGKEYKYASEVRIGTGTMDYAPHLAGSVHRMKTRVQASNGGNTLNVEVNIYFLDQIRAQYIYIYIIKILPIYPLRSLTSRKVNMSVQLTQETKTQML